MEVGVGLFGNADYMENIKALKGAGINKTFVGSEIPYFDEAMKAFKDNGIICETLHAPYNRINDMYKEEGGDEMLARLKDGVDKCAKYDVPVLIVHLSSGRPMPDINESGEQRFKALFDYADEKGVIIAIENQRYRENIEYFMGKYKNLKFCWDNGHEASCSKGIKFMSLFGDRLVALHIHDNECGVDTDNHVLPFDGNIDFKEVAEILGENGYKGTLMLEVSKNSSFEGVKIYEDLTMDEFVKKAAESVRKLSDMVESCRKVK